MIEVIRDLLLDAGFSYQASSIGVFLLFISPVFTISIFAIKASCKL